VIVLDTHAWLWWQTADEKLSSGARSEIANADTLGVCSISCYEVTRAAARGRIRLDREPGAWLGQALTADRVETLVLTHRIAAEAGALGPEFPGDPVDRIIYATTVEYGARLVTRDRELRRLDPLRTVW
jgi:PIN domain nuclease of toxin-antitoxin system